MKTTNCTIMRGGTSKALFFLHEDMPKNSDQWDDFLLDVMGSPDQRQIDGLGGADPLTSKVAIIKKSDKPGIDVEYTFAQVSLTARHVGWQGNCGNTSTAVGPFAINEKLVKATQPLTRVTILNTNTGKKITAEVEVENGAAKTKGSFTVPGVPGTGSPVKLAFFGSEGALTGKLLPTGRPQDLISTPFGEIPISIVDSAASAVFINAADLGLTGAELPTEYTKETLQRIEAIRSYAAELCGYCKREDAQTASPQEPKAAIISPAITYADLTGIIREAADMDLSARMMSMGKPHKALATTGAVCLTAAAATPGTLVHQITGGLSGPLRIGHTSGIMATSADINEDRSIGSITISSTARTLMKGTAYLKG